MRLGIAIAAAALCLGCQFPTCPPARSRPGATESVLPWLEPTRPRVEIVHSGAVHKALLDTGFPRSSIAVPSVDPGFFPISTSVALGGATVAPVSFDVIPIAAPGLDMIIGADVLTAVPLVMDARAAETRVLLDFTPEPGAAPLERWSAELCRGGSPDNGPEGPDLFLVEANLDGVPLTLVLDTGADITLVRQDALVGLSSRPSLSGLPVHTAFAGDFTATITRARTLSVGNQSSAASPVLVSPQIDQGLDELLRRFPAGGPEQLDGALGWSFLREFEVSLALGEDELTDRELGLTRFDTQTHWSRDFVGVGIATRESPIPSGLQIVAFLSNSPARDAGLQIGDVIISVGGEPALGLRQPWGNPGEVVQIGFQRPGTNAATAPVTIADLLPDP
ncbi:MAG TPA: aspartyl protease family protein [Myxococcaceae bacterium]|jgi:hypothetical protein